MFNSRFYKMESDQIGQTSYVYKRPIQIDNQTKDRLQLQNSSAYIQKFLMDMVFNPGAVGDPNQLYATSRKDTHKLIQQTEAGDLYSQAIYLQVNNQDSYDLILKIEKDPNFVNWIDPDLIERFKQSYRRYIKK